MVQFTQVSGGAVYLASGNLGGSGWAFVLTVNPLGTPSPNLPPGPFSLGEALSWQDDAWVGSLVYVAAAAPAIADDPAAFAASITTIRADSFNGPSALIFLPNPSVATGSAAAVQALIDSGAIYVVILSNANGQITPLSFFNVTLTGVPGVTAQFSSTVVLTVPDEAGDACILFSPSDSSTSPAIVLGGPVNPQQAVPRTSTSRLRFEGVSSGAFGFDVAIDRVSLSQDLNMGFQLLVPNPASSTNPTLAVYLPLADPGPGDGTAVEFWAEVNILNPNNTVAGAAETRFSFLGTNKIGATESPTILASYYRTNYGKPVALVPVTDGQAGSQPARLVIDPGQQETILQNGFRFTPAGDFVARIDGAAAGVPEALLCGLAGTETIALLPEIDGAQPGERIRFVPGQPANAPQFPLLPVSPVGPPLDPKATLLDALYRTSWAGFLAPPDDSGRRALYAAAPKGAELFGIAADSNSTGLLGPQNPGVAMPPDASVVYPLFPMAGFTAGTGQQDITSDGFELLNRQIVGPTRKSAIDQGIGAGLAGPSASAHHSLQPSAATAGGDGLTSTTTPTGFITRYDGTTGEWKQLLLGQVTSGGSVSVQMGFTDLGALLQAAFQTNDQFLVIANNAELGPFTAPADGKPGPSVFMPPADADIVDQPYFFNRVDIGQWRFTANPGVQNQYGDYRSVMIVKGVKGRILDVDQTGAVTPASLLRSPDNWTMRDVFASPDPPDMSELVPLSTWLVDYCKDAYDQRGDPYFAKIAAILTDPDWTGVLILKAAIAEVPSDVVGILAGVKDPTNFFAHHIGIDIGQIDKDTVLQKGTTSMFGLVHYIDPRYDDSLPPHTIPPLDLDAVQDFSLLTLKALFENSAVRKFESLAQMVLNQLFGSAVTSMVDVRDGTRTVNPNNAVLLVGGVQKNGDAVVYSLASKWPNQYFLANNVLGNVEIDTAVMSTRDDGTSSGQIVSWIGLSGFMNFIVVPAIPDPGGGAGLPAFDVFSYGPEPGDDDVLRQGLNFSNLGLLIKASVGGSGAPPTLALVESEIAFNNASSHARQQSLFRNFQLGLLGLVSGDASGSAGATKSDPVSLGFLPVVTQYNLRGMPARWHGLRFKLDLGTPGALAGKLKLDSNLLVAWADDSGAATPDIRSAMVAIQLPGAGGGGELFSLQTVIKLSIGLIQLMYTAPDPATQSAGGFVLVMNEIALKLLGLLKIPPSGNTAFLLFGDPEAAEASGLGWFAVYNKAKESQA